MKQPTTIFSYPIEYNYLYGIDKMLLYCSHNLKSMDMREESFINDMQYNCWYEHFIPAPKQIKFIQKIYYGIKIDSHCFSDQGLVYRPTPAFSKTLKNKKNTT